MIWGCSSYLFVVFFWGGCFSLKWREADSVYATVYTVKYVKNVHVSLAHYSFSRSTIHFATRPAYSSFVGFTLSCYTPSVDDLRICVLADEQLDSPEHTQGFHEAIKGHGTEDDQHTSAKTHRHADKKQRCTSMWIHNTYGPTKTKKKLSQKCEWQITWAAAAQLPYGFRSPLHFY